MVRNKNSTLVKDKFIESLQNKEAEALIKIQKTGISEKPELDDTISSREEKLIAQFQQQYNKVLDGQFPNAYLSEKADQNSKDRNTNSLLSNISAPY